MAYSTMPQKGWQVGEKGMTTDRKVTGKSFVKIQVSIMAPTKISIEIVLTQGN